MLKEFLNFFLKVFYKLFIILKDLAFFIGCLYIKINNKWLF